MASAAGIYLATYDEMGQRCWWVIVGSGYRALVFPFGKLSGLAVGTMSPPDLWRREERQH